MWLNTYLNTYLCKINPGTLSLLTSPSTSPGPAKSRIRKREIELDIWAVTKISWATYHPPPHPTTLRGLFRYQECAQSFKVASKRKSVGKSIMFKENIINNT